MKSLQRLHIDPLAVYGTNCFKFDGGDEEQAPSVLHRELHIVQPKLLVVMGEDALAFLNELGFPLAGELEAKPGAPAVDADGQGTLRPGHRRLARRAGGEDLSGGR